MNIRSVILTCGKPSKFIGPSLNFLIMQDLKGKNIFLAGSSAVGCARKARTYRASAMAAAARVDRSFFVLPFSFVTFLLGKQKKSNQVPAHVKYLASNKFMAAVKQCLFKLLNDYYVIVNFTNSEPTLILTAANNSKSEI